MLWLVCDEAGTMSSGGGGYGGGGGGGGGGGARGWGDEDDYGVRRSFNQRDSACVFAVYSCLRKCSTAHSRPV